MTRSTAADGTVQLGPALRVRVEDLVSITVEPAARLYHANVRRFDVVAHLVDRSMRTLATRLLRADADDLAAAAIAAVERARGTGAERRADP